MFGRRKDTPFETLQDAEIPAGEHVQEPDNTEVTEELGAVALIEQKGFTPHESGLLVPDGTAKVSVEQSGEVLVTDTRRITLEKVEAIHEAEQERLKSPLEKHEIVRALTFAETQMRQRLAENESADYTTRNDMGRDIASLARVRNILEGQRDMYVSHVVDSNQELSGSEMLGRVVAHYAKLVPRNFDEGTHIGSMGGTVEVPDDGVIHCEGYNGSILYEFARAQQIYRKLETMPKEVREKITEAAMPDASFLYDEPVVVDPSLTKLESVA